MSNALVDDRTAHFGQPVDIRFTRAIVTALDRVVEQTPNAVAVVRVVLGGVDAALCSDAVGPAGGFVIGECKDIVTQFGKGRSSRCTRQSRPDNDNAVFPLVGGIDQLHVELMFGPFLFYGSGRNFRVEFHGSLPSKYNRRGGCGMKEVEVDWQRCETCRNDKPEEEGNKIKDSLVLLVHEAQGLECRLKTVFQVIAENQQSDLVEQAEPQV